MSTNPAFILVLRTSPWKDELGHAWELVCRGAERGLFVADELPELIEYLGNGWDYGFDELLFEFHGDAFHVRFLDDSAECDPAQMTRALQGVNEQRTAEILLVNDDSPGN